MRRPRTLSVKGDASESALTQAVPREYAVFQKGAVGEGDHPTA
jgi:hypothetical protein